MKMRTILVAMLALAAGCALMEDLPAEDGIERWECGPYSYYGCSGNCPVRLTANFRDGTGEVSFDGVVERTSFQIQGLERRWDWCLENGAFECAFVITVDGRGWYYNFRAGEYRPDGTRRAVPPADRFTCEKSWGDTS